MKNSLQLSDEKDQLKKRAFEMIDQCKVEIRNFNEDEQKEFDHIKEQITEINSELRKINQDLEKVDSEVSEERNLNPNNQINQNKENIQKKQNNTMEKNFSLVKAIRSIANNQKMDSLTEAVVNAGSAEMRKAGLNYTGQIQLPSNETRAITVTDEGEDVVATNLVDIIRPLQSRNVMIQAGAKYVTGLQGDVQYPVMTKANVTWEGETAKTGDSAVTFTNVKLSPKRLSVVVPISKQLIVQDTVGVEQAIREEIYNAINSKIEETILGDGAGSLTEPKGLFPNEGDSGLTALTDFAKITELESELEDVTGEVKYLVSPKAKADLRNMAKSAKSTQLVMEGGEIDGTPALCTSHLKNKHVVYGDMSQYIIAQWGGGLDIVVDPLTLAGEGQIRLVVNCYYDMKPLRENAIKVAKVGA